MFYKYSVLEIEDKNGKRRGIKKYLLTKQIIVWQNCLKRLINNKDLAKVYYLSEIIITSSNNNCG